MDTKSSGEKASELMANLNEIRSHVEAMMPTGPIVPLVVDCRGLALSLIQRAKRAEAAAGFKEDLKRDMPTEGEILAGLSVLEESSATWRAVHGLLQVEIDNDTTGTGQAGISSELRHYRAGRMAALLDFQGILLQVWVKGRSRKDEG
jgi:hypothetical protein